jgi:hypothetical protein
VKNLREHVTLENLSTQRVALNCKLFLLLAEQIGHVFCNSGKGLNDDLRQFLIVQNRAKTEKGL